MLSINEIRECTSGIAEKYHISRIDLFGSYANGTAHENSDVDLLVEFGTPYVTLITLSGLKLELEDILGKNIDIIHAPIPKNSLLMIEETIPIYEKPRQTNSGENTKQDRYAL